MKKKLDKQLAMKVSWISIVANILLMIFKLLVGIIYRSYALVSDAVHSASDVFSTFIVMLGVNISSKESDDKHPYGHERFECVAALILATILLITGIGIGYAGLNKIIQGDYKNIIVPGLVALIAAIISIIVKEIMFRYTKFAAKKIDSGALMADAWHHRSDALSSVGSFIGILGARMGYPILDFIASIVICIFIIKAAISIYIDAVRKITDEACDEKTQTEIKEFIESQKGVEHISSLKTRKFGNRVYVDLEIVSDASHTFLEAHKIAERVHDEIELKFPIVKHCTVHTNPTCEKNKS